VTGNIKVVMVTGAGSGIGAAIARHFAARGWGVLVNYAANRAGAEATVEACREAGGDAVACQGDVAEDADCRRLADAALARWGRIDALVNNAGVTKFVPAPDLDGLAAEDFQRIFAVNVIGAFQMARAVAPAMRTQGAGAIVNLSSFAGLRGFGSSLAYAASKGALNTLTLGLARVLAPEIRVNAVCPSFAETEWLAKGVGNEKSEQFKSKVAAAAPLKRIASVEDIAETVFWLVTGARHLTGELVTLAGGLQLTTGLD
jgi:NAD(P)-dependent dehydrogenase (short-subunit alcohol dehydrogenase family)